MCELRLDEDWFEFCHVRAITIHEHDVDNVITNMPLSFNLKKEYLVNTVLVLLLRITLIHKAYLSTSKEWQNYAFSCFDFMSQKDYICYLNLQS